MYRKLYPSVPKSIIGKRDLLNDQGSLDSLGVDYNPLEERKKTQPVLAKLSDVGMKRRDGQHNRNEGRFGIIPPITPG